MNAIVRICGKEYWVWDVKERKFVDEAFFITWLADTCRFDFQRVGDPGVDDGVCDGDNE